MKKYQVSYSGQNWSEGQERPKESFSVLEGARSQSAQQMQVKVGEHYQQLTWSRNNQGIWVTVSGKTFVFKPAAASESSSSVESSLQSPMPAKVIEVMVKEGDSVKAEQALIRLEAMKMEFVIKAPKDGVIKKLKAVTGEQVEAGVALVDFE